MQLKRIKANRIYMLMIFVALYPILPSYNRIGDCTSYLILALLFFAIYLIRKAHNIMFVDKKYAQLSVAIILLYSVGFIYNDQPERIVFELLDVWLPITLMCLALYDDYNKENIEKLITVLIVASSFLCVSGLIEHFTSFNLFSLIENMTYENPNFGSIQANRFGIIRIEQSFNTALTFALYLVMAFSLTAYRFITRRKIIYFIIMALQIVNILFTLTRGVTLIFLAGAFGMLWINRRAIGLNRFLTILFGALCAIILAFYMFPQLSELVEGLMDSTLQVLSRTSRLVDESSRMRSNYQMAAFNALKNPRVVVFGVGEYELRRMISIDNEWLLELTGYGMFGIVGFVLLLSHPLLISIKGILLSKKHGLSTARVFFNCMLILMIEYMVSLYTVAQMAEARMFYVIYVIICFYFKTERRQIWHDGVNGNIELQ